MKKHLNVAVINEGNECVNQITTIIRINIAHSYHL